MKSWQYNLIPYTFHYFLVGHLVEDGSPIRIDNEQYKVPDDNYLGEIQLHYIFSSELACITAAIIILFSNITTYIK